MDDISFKVFVGSIDFNATEKDVEEAFKPYGEIVHVILLRDKETQKSRGFGFVTFKEKHSVEAAIKGMHRQPILGRPIVVNYAEKKSHTNSGANQNNVNSGAQQQMQTYGGSDSQQQQQQNQFFSGYAGQQGYAGWNQQGYGNWGPYWQQGYGAWGQWWNQQMQGQQQQYTQQQQGTNQAAAGGFQSYQNFNGMQPSQNFNGNSNNTSSNNTNGSAGGGF